MSTGDGAVGRLGAGQALDDTLGGGSPTGRIGVAIEVPGPLGRQIQEQRAASGDPLAWSVPAHVTLVPPVEVGHGSMAAVRRHLLAVAAASRPFRIHLRGTGTFRPVSRVVYVRLESGGEQVARIEETARSGVLAGRRRFPFHPHVTIAQEVDDAALDRAGESMAGFDASFTADSITLYRHDGDGVWRVAEAYPLG